MRRNLAYAAWVVVALLLIWLTWPIIVRDGTMMWDRLRSIL